MTHPYDDDYDDDDDDYDDDDDDDAQRVVWLLARKRARCAVFERGVKSMRSMRRFRRVVI